MYAADMKKKLREAKLYLVLDAQVCDYEKLFEILKLAAESDVDVIQLRDKEGKLEDVLDFCKRALNYLKGKIPFIINDRVEIAYTIGCDGVHLGQEDLSLKFAREILGDNAIIGVSCQTLEHAIRAEEEGADYIGFGSVFKTLTKPDRKKMDLTLLSDVLKKVRIPVFPIGGITPENAGKVVDAGADRIAVTRSLCLAADVRTATKQFLEILA